MCLLVTKMSVKSFTNERPLEYLSLKVPFLSSNISMYVNKISRYILINNITKSTKHLLGRVHQKFHNAPNHLHLKVYPQARLLLCCLGPLPSYLPVSTRKYPKIRRQDHYQKLVVRLSISLCVPQFEIPICPETNPEAETVL